MSIIIDKEFQALIPPLTEEEFRQLEENCVKEGIRDALVVWSLPNGGQILLDGHNRYQISRKYDLPYEVKQMKFDLRDDAKAWIIRNQFGRRNIPAYVRAELALKLKPLIAKKAKEQQIRKSVTQKSAEQKPIETRKELAKLAGVSHDTIHKVEVIQQNAPEEIKDKARRGEISTNEAYHQTMKALVPIKKPDYAKEAEEEHREYEEKRKDGIVSIRDASVDKLNRRTLALDLSKRITKASNAVSEITLLRGDLKSIISELTPEEKKDAQRIIRMTISELTALNNQIGG